MGTKDPRIDAYIAKSADFAKPILTHLRDLIHDNCPTVEETMKWSFPHFMYTSAADRKSRVLCSMASFKQHCAFGFWYSGGWVLSDETRPSSEGMGQFGKITGLPDLPKDKQLVKQIKDAMKVHDQGIQPSSRPKNVEKKELEVPADLAAALKKSKKAMTAFDGFSYTNKKEYVDWITEAKSDETRKKRLETAVEWMSEGKSRHWKYQKK